MAVILQFPAVVTVRDAWWKKRLLLALIQAGLVAAYVVRAVLLIVRWILNPRSRKVAAAAAGAERAWQLTKGGVATPVPSPRAARRA